MFFATTIASIFPAIIFGSIFLFLGPSNSWAILAMLIAFTVSFIHIIFLGIPCILILQKNNLLNLYSTLCVGFFLGCFFAVALSFIYSDSCAGCSYKAGAEWLIIDGVRTTDGWHEYIIQIIATGLLGALVSGVFYAVFRRVKP